jgi:hypothetical protein
VTVTRANVEVELISRIGRLLTAAGLDGTTVNGANASLAGPIAYAIRASGGALANLLVVTDADLAAFDVALMDQLLDLAELRALENALGNYDGVDIRVGQRSESFSQLGTRLADRIAILRGRLLTIYGIGAGSLTAGVIDLAFAEDGDLP